MPKTHKQTLQKFLLNLIEKPHTLNQLKADPKAFITKSALSKTHKQILLGNDTKKIKSIVTDAVSGQELPITIVTDLTLASGAMLPEAIHIVFGPTQSQVKVSVKPKISKNRPAVTKMVGFVLVTEPNA